MTLFEDITLLAIPVNGKYCQLKLLAVAVIGSSSYFSVNGNYCQLMLLAVAVISSSRYWQLQLLTFTGNGMVGNVLPSFELFLCRESKWQVPALTVIDRYWRLMAVNGRQ